MYGYIYLTTNLVNGKKYIGKKESSVFDPNYHGSGKYICRAIKKYGTDSFVTEILCWCENLDELNNSERYFIKLHNAVKSKDYYNIHEGGSGGNVIAGYTDEDMQQFKNNMSKEFKGRKHMIKDGVRRYVRPEDIDRYLLDGWEFFHKKMSEEDRLRTSETSKNRKYITNGQINKLVKIEELDYYLSNGFKLGQTRSKKQIEYQSRKNEQYRLKCEKELSDFIEAGHTCARCGTIMTKKYGSGKYCCKSCAASHPHSDETKKLLSDMNRSGKCGRKGMKSSEATKQRLRDSINKYHQSHELIWVTDGKTRYHIDITEFDKYAEMGFKRGVLLDGETRIAWNKGLDTSDERVKRGVVNREKCMLDKYGTLDVFKIKNMKETNKKDENSE